MQSHFPDVLYEWLHRIADAHNKQDAGRSDSIVEESVRAFPAVAWSRLFVSGCFCFKQLGSIG